MCLGQSCRGPIKPGDEILPMSGNHVDITIARYYKISQYYNISNSEVRELAAVAGQIPLTVMRFSMRLSALWALLAIAAPSSAFAQFVYPGCTVPPTTFNHIWYIDPVHGQTPAAMTAAGVPVAQQGTQAHPWNSLQAVFWQTTGYAYPLLTSVPYVTAGTGRTTGPKSGPIQPGDEVLLMSGNYGVVNVGQYLAPIANPYFVTIAAAPGQTPALSGLNITASSKFAFSGLIIEKWGGNGPLVWVTDQGPTMPTSDIVFQKMSLLSITNTSGWT